MKNIITSTLLIPFIGLLMSSSNKREVVDTGKIEQKADMLTSSTFYENDYKKLLIGKWQSTDDANYHIAFTKEDKIDSYNGENTGQEPYILASSCLNESDKGGDGPSTTPTYISVQKSNMCWYIINLDQQQLSLAYMGRGNSLNFRRLKNKEDKSATTGLISQNQVEAQIKFIREKFGIITKKMETDAYSTVEFQVEGGGEFVVYKRSMDGADIRFLSVAKCHDHGCDKTSYYFWDNKLIFKYDENSLWVGRTDEVSEFRTYYLNESEIKCLTREKKGAGGYDEVKKLLSKTSQTKVNCHSLFNRKSIEGLLGLTKDKAAAFFYGE